MYPTIVPLNEELTAMNISWEKVKLVPFSRLSIQWNSENRGNAPILIKGINAGRVITW